MNSLDPDLVAVRAGLEGYPEDPPFHPHETWPESPFGEVSPVPNPVYRGVRDAFRLLGLDAEAQGTPEWNPLGAVVHPGDLVVLKPNLVRHWNGAEDHITALVTHGSVVRAVLDYVLIALRGEGEIIVGDAPVQEADFDSVCRQNGLAETVAWCAERAGGVRVSLIDWRRERAHTLETGTILETEALPGDPRGFVEVDLGRDSFLTPLEDAADRFRVTNYDRGAMREVHTRERNCYLISGSVLRADVVITLPKMKCHGKAGVTCCLKNNVGINGHKDWLPHHREGSREEGGDEYEHKSLRKRLLTALTDRADRVSALSVKKALYYAGQALRRTARIVPCKDPYLEGSWYGNDTVWRMCLDLNRILFFVDAEGRLRDTPQRRYFGLIDGVVAGEADGPLHPRSKRAGVLVAGSHPAAMDLVCCRLMGFDDRKVPLIRGAFDQESRPVLHPGGPENVRVVSNHAPFERLFELARSETLAFEPHRGWKGHVEL